MNPKWKKPRANKKNKKSKTGSKKALVKTIKRVVAGTQETKNARSYFSFPTQMQLVLPSQYVQLLPNIKRVGSPVAVGSTAVWASTDGTRVGNAISPTSIKTHVTLTLQETTYALDLYAVIYIFNIKGYDNYGDQIPSGGNPPDFLDNCDGTQRAFNGDLYSLDQPLYRNTFKLLHKRIVHLKRDPGPVNGPAATGNGYGPINTQYRHTFNIPHPKVLKYQQDEVTANNCAPVMFVSYVYADGTAPETIAREVLVTQQTFMYYKDS